MVSFDSKVNKSIFSPRSFFNRKESVQYSGLGQVVYILFICHDCVNKKLCAPQYAQLKIHFPETQPYYMFQLSVI